MIPGVKPYYEDDTTTLYHGDCRELLPLMPEGSVDLVLTDPPYGIELSNHDSTGQYRRTRAWDIVGDNDLQAALVAADWARSHDIALAMFASPDKPLPGKWRNRLVWHKDGLGMGGDPDTCWRRDWELILIDGTGVLDGGRDSAVLRFPIRPSEFIHPCQKPVSLCEYLITKTAASRILDPFAGSGTTGVAAKQLGRKCVLMEISEAYCEIAAKRLEATEKGLEVREIDSGPEGAV